MCSSIDVVLHRSCAEPSYFAKFRIKINKGFYQILPISCGQNNSFCQKDYLAEAINRLGGSHKGKRASSLENNCKSIPDERQV
jgi:hypothetical protein